MKERYIVALGLAIVATIFGSEQQSVAAPPSYAQAVKDYNSGNYTVALSEFSQMKAAYPYNALVRYYIGLCEQSLGHLPQAKFEFIFVSQNGDAKLKANAQSALAQLSNVTEKANNPLIVQNPGQARVANPGHVAAPNPGVSAPASRRVKKIVLFYSDTSDSCKEFAPVFDAARSKLRDIQFERINTGDPGGQALAQQFGINSLPRVIMSDTNENVLFNGTPGRDEGAFLQQVASCR
jgi:thiol-disulfide isomerase/thioredoxin